MSKENNLKDFCTDIADAIREKKGTTDLINPQDFADEIRNLPSGGDIDALVARTITEYENNTIEEISAYVFAYCTALRKVTIPNVRKIETLCFAHCSSVTEFHAPLMEDLGEQSLRNMSITKFDFPHLKTIRAYAFSTTKLQALVLSGNSVCSLANVNALGNTPIANGTGYIYVPVDLVDAYKSATNWSTYADQIKSLDELPA